MSVSASHATYRLDSCDPPVRCSRGAVCLTLQSIDEFLIVVSPRAERQSDHRRWLVRESRGEQVDETSREWSGCAMGWAWAECGAGIGVDGCGCWRRNESERSVAVSEIASTTGPGPHNTSALQTHADHAAADTHH